MVKLTVYLFRKSIVATRPSEKPAEILVLVLFQHVKDPRRTLQRFGKSAVFDRPDVQAFIKARTQCTRRG